MTSFNDFVIIRAVNNIYRSILVLLVMLAACAPTHTANEKLYTGRPYNGEIHKAMIIASTPMQLQNMRNLVYDSTLYALMTHPFYSSRYIFVDREHLDQVLTEMNLAASGIIDPTTAPTIGSMVGAQYMFIIKLVSAEFKPVNLSGVHIGNISVGGNAVAMNVAMQLSLLEAESSRLLATTYGRYSKMAPVGLSVASLNVGSSVSEDALSPLINHAVKDLVNKLAKQIDIRFEVVKDE